MPPLPHRNRTASLNRAAVLALVAALSLWACSEEAATDMLWDPREDATSSSSASSLLFIEVPAEGRRADLPPLDPDADPRTPLGELRSKYLPLWTSDFDGAFPPAVCGSAWELDGIAAPVSGVRVSHYGDPAVMAALGVMRYEFLLAQAHADPARLNQLCVAVAAVDPARADALAAYADAITAAEPSASADLESASLQPPSRPGAISGERGHQALPAEVTLIAVSTSSVVAVACIKRYPTKAADTGASNLGSASAAARLMAYELEVSRGLEDAVIDISLRVARTQERDASDCSDLAGWLTEWRQKVDTWIDDGQAWLPLAQTLTPASICSAAPADDRDHCPTDWHRLLK